MGKFKFKIKPFNHQRREFEDFREEVFRAILWEQGTGKTKLTIDTVCWLFLEEKIDGLLVVAPNGVHENWATDELPDHMVDSVPWRVHVFDSQKSKTKKAKRDIEEMLKFDGLHVLCMSIDAFMTQRGKNLAWDFLKKFRTFYVLDESSDIKTPGAKRTKSVIASGRYASFRRILNGTPVDNKPFDVYSQFRFLDEHFWRKYSIGSFAAFKTMFGVWQDMVNQNGQQFKVLVEYKNIEMLHKIVDACSTRVLKEDVLDLPQKLYSKRYFELSPEQKRCYEELRQECMTIVASGEVVTAALAIVQLLRFQQITCGYLPKGDESDDLALFPSNPRLALLGDIVERTTGSMIIWARFQKDIDLIMDLLKSKDIKAGRYDGKVKNDERAKVKKEFQDGVLRAFVGNPAACSRGLTLHKASTVIYYNNSFKLSHRLQSEDRAHRIGQKKNVTYIDIICKDTVDERIVQNLRSKVDIASQVTGDKLKEWI